jgi:hypothetical protein
MASGELSQQVTRRFSLNWTWDRSGVKTAGEYTIRPSGDAHELLFRGTSLHLAATAYECQVEADRHRGVSR